MKYQNYEPNLLSAEYLSNNKFSSSKEIMKLLKEEFNITDKEVELVSFGNNGAFMFFVDNNNILNKIRLSNIGITYIHKSNFIKLIDELPIKNKQRKNNDNTYTSLND